MTKKDYERAATIVQSMRSDAIGGLGIYSSGTMATVEGTFARFFRDDNPRFDEARFRAACVPGANVRARPRKVGA